MMVISLAIASNSHKNIADCRKVTPSQRSLQTLFPWRGAIQPMVRNLGNTEVLFMALLIVSPTSCTSLGDIPILEVFHKR